MRRACLAVLFAAGLVLAGPRALAMSIKQQNVVDLLRDSDAIVVGKVQKVTDGIDEKGVPYTEVSLAVSESIRGELPQTTTFRQFGLMNPRPTADGTKVMMPAPEGFPRYAPGEDVLLFLYPPAGWTGFRTTAGLVQGKFTIGPGRLENGVGNAGLFRDVRLDQTLAADADRKMLATVTGAVSPDAFLSFVRRAVKERWVETGRLRNTRAQ